MLCWVLHICMVETILPEELDRQDKGGRKGMLLFLPLNMTCSRD